MTSPSSHASGDFTADGYPLLKFRFGQSAAIQEDREHTVKLRGKNEVPEVSSKAKGAGTLDLVDAGTRITYKLKFETLKNVESGAGSPEGTCVLLSGGDGTPSIPPYTPRVVLLVEGE